MGGHLLEKLRRKKGEFRKNNLTAGSNKITASNEGKREKGE